MRAWFLLFLALAVVARPQSATTHQHTVVDSPPIEGKDHPEQIPDLAAYRLFLGVISRSATEDEKARQDDLLKAMGLSDPLKAKAILASYYTSRQELKSAYNVQARAANDQGKLIDPDTRAHFFTDRDSLVRKTHDDLKSTLSPQDWARFDAYVQNEKHGMTIPASEGVK